MDLALDLDPNSPNYLDLLIRQGDLVLTSDANPYGTDDVLQHVLQRIRVYKGEYYLDTSVGVPYFQTIFRKGASIADYDAAYRAVILATPGVRALLSYTSNITGRLYNMAFRAQRLGGIIDYSSSVNMDTGVLT